MSKKPSSNTKKASPEAPKRPLNSYMRWQMENREQYLKKNPDLNNKQLLKLISDEWKKTTEQQRKKYVDAYDKDKKKFDEDMMAYEEKYGKVEKETKKKEEKKEEKKEVKVEKRGRKMEKSSEGKRKGASKGKAC